MRVRLVVAMLGVGLLPGMALADKTQSSLINPEGFNGTAIPALVGPVGVAFTNGVSKGKVKNDNKCKLQIKISGLAIADTDGLPGTGDEIICIGDGHLRSPLAGGTIDVSAVTRGEVVGGKVLIKRDLEDEGTPCLPTGGGTNAKQFDTRLACYEADGAYAPVFTFPFTSDPTQGLIFFAFAARPATPLIITSGSFSE